MATVMTQAEWFEKIKTWVPSWFFENERLQVAFFQALAKLLSGMDTEIRAQINETFISQAIALTLDLHGSERGVTRLTDETDASYSLRIRRITSKTDKQSIKDTVDALLRLGECQLLEPPQDGPYCSRDTYCSRDSFVSNYKRNYFNLIIPKQSHAPYSFCSRDLYSSRDGYVGSVDSSPSILRSIIAAVDRQKAFGVLYRLYVSNHH